MSTAELGADPSAGCRHLHLRQRAAGWPTSNAGTTFYIHVQDPLLQPLSAAHAPQLGLTPAMLEVSPTGTLRGYIDQAPASSRFNLKANV